MQARRIRIFKDTVGSVNGIVRLIDVGNLG